MSSPCSIVIATYNRRARLAATLAHLTALPERPDIIVVDNGSTDGTLDDIGRLYPRVKFVRLPKNVGAAARNVGAQVAVTPYVAFCDDDCWWSAGSLGYGSSLLEAHTGVGLLNARVIVNGDHVDPACLLMAQSNVPKRTACPGEAIVQFMAGACIVRRSAFVAAGGYHGRYFLGAEESLLALDLLERGWELLYVADLILHHAPYPLNRKLRERQIAVTRNRLWTTWLRHSQLAAWAATISLAGRAARDGVARAALAEALGGLHWVVRERRPVRSNVERLARTATELAP